MTLELQTNTVSQSLVHLLSFTCVLALDKRQGGLSIRLCSLPAASWAA